MTSLAATDEIDIALVGGPATDAFGLSVEIDGVEATETVAADGPGVFRRSRRIGDEPVHAVGRIAAPGDIVGFLQRGPLLTPVRMPRGGWILAAIPDLTRVGHGEPLIRILLATGAIKS